MKTKLGLASIFVILLWGCASPETKVVEKTVEPVVHVSEVDGAPKTIANLGIEGMSCERACGGSIKKALLKMDGVITADIKFDVNEDVNFAVVEFDESKVTSDEMVKVLSDLNKGQFTVKSVAIEKQVNKTSQTSETKGKSQNKSNPIVGEVEASSLYLPNVLDILNSLLR